jgi:NADH-quinone oxidoreductase subunit J
MFYPALFVIISAIGIILAILVFAFRDILHSALALAGVFLVNSLFFLFLDQPILAVVQLFIMVGGITTFLFVGVASAPYSKFKYTKLAYLCILWVVLLIAMIVPLGSLGISASQSNIFDASGIANSLGTATALYYLMLLLMFGVSLGAVLLLKKAGAGK